MATPNMTSVDSSQPQESPIRVLIANLYGAMFEVVLATVEQAGFVSKQHETGLDELVGAVNGNCPDVLIIGARHVYPPPAICRELWYTFPALKVLIITPSGDAAVMYWLGLQRNRLDTVSSEVLVNTIRSVHQLDLMDD
jgi:hypothetical protein